MDKEFRGGGALSVPTIDGEARQYVGPDGTITLTCWFSSLHLLGTTWLLNGEDVSSTLGEGNSISGDPTTSTLMFDQFDAALHSGTYQCQVQGLLGDLVSRTVDVLPAKLPVIQREPTDLTVSENGLAFFDCFPDLDTVPHPTVQWRYNGAPLDVSNTTKYRVNPQTARLFISVVTASDEGQYSCTLSNLQGSVSSGTGTLTVLGTPGGSPDKPDYLAGPGRDTGTIEVLEGTNLTVECAADTVNPSVSYSWNHPSGIRNSRIATEVDYPTPNRFVNLELSNMLVSMSREYEVQVRLPELGTGGVPLNANSPRSVTVDVQAAPTISSVTDAVLTCTLYGNPSPTVHGLKMPADLTSYQCHLTNKRGSSVRETFLCGQPGVPGAVIPKRERAHHLGPSGRA